MDIIVRCFYSISNLQPYKDRKYINNDDVELIFFVLLSYIGVYNYMQANHTIHKSAKF